MPRNLRFTLIMNASRAIVSSAPFVFSDVLALVSEISEAGCVSVFFVKP